MWLISERNKYHQKDGNIIYNHLQILRLDLFWEVLWQICKLSSKMATASHCQARSAFPPSPHFFQQVSFPSWWMWSGIMASMCTRTCFFLETVSTAESRITLQCSCSFSKPARLSWLTTSSFSKVLCQSTTTTGFSKPLVALPWVVLPWDFSKSLGLDFSKSWAGLLFFFLPSFSKVAVGFSKPEEELAAAGVSTAFLGWPLLPLCLAPPALGSSEVESCSNFLVTACFCLFQGFQVLGQDSGVSWVCLFQGWPLHPLPSFLPGLGSGPMTKLPPLFVGGPFRLVHLFQDFPVQGGFSNPLSFSQTQSQGRLFQTQSPASAAELFQAHQQQQATSGVVVVCADCEV